MIDAFSLVLEKKTFGFESGFIFTLGTPPGFTVASRLPILDLRLLFALL